jgi:basic membrane protein A and related proteins
MNKTVGIVALLVVILVAVLFLKPAPKESGSKAGPTPGNANGAAAGSDFKVGLVTPGAINDGGWSQTAYEGLRKIEKELGAKVSNSVASSTNEAFAAFRLYANEKYNIVIGHASEWFDPKTQEIAAANPNTIFLISGSERADKNLAGVRFLLEDAAYVCGQIAAGMSKSGILGCVGPKEVPVIESTFFAFKSGAESVRKDIKVNIVWTNDWADVARAKERTLILIEQGADFIFHNANDGAPGVFEAAQEKRKQGANVYVFGSNADQNKMAEDVILASAVLDIPGAYMTVVKEIQAGHFQSEPHFLGIPQGNVWMSYNPKLADKIPADVRKLADETVEKIKTYKFTAPRRDLK